MKKRILLVSFISLIVIFSVLLYRFSIKNNNDLDNEYPYVANSEPVNIRFEAGSIDEFINKIQAGDIRSTSQEEYNNWQEQCKALYNRWYEIGKIPSISCFEENSIESYSYSNDMIVISFKKENCEDKSYYDIITLSSDQKNISDIEEYYNTVLYEQDEFLKSVGGTYSDININGQITNAAICNHFDGTKSVDFIWNNKYWIRMWDKQMNIDIVLQNFNIREEAIEKPDGFDEVSFCNKISYADNYDQEYNTIFDSKDNPVLFNASEESISIQSKDMIDAKVESGYNENYKLDNVRIYKSKMHDDEYYQYMYIDDLEQNYYISVYSFRCIDNYLEENRQYCINRLYESNPCSYDTEKAEIYGIYEKTEVDNSKYYYDDTLDIEGKEYCALSFAKDGDDYSEIAYVFNNQFVKIFCYKEKAIDELKVIASKIYMDDFH